MDIKTALHKLCEEVDRIRVIDPDTATDQDVYERWIILKRRMTIAISFLKPVAEHLVHDEFVEHGECRKPSYCDIAIHFGGKTQTLLENARQNYVFNGDSGPWRQRLKKSLKQLNSFDGTTLEKLITQEIKSLLPAKQDEDRDWIRVGVAARMLGVTPATVGRLVLAEKLVDNGKRNYDRRIRISSIFEHAQAAGIAINDT